MARKYFISQEKLQFLGLQNKCSSRICKTDFYPKMIETISGAIGLQIEHGLAF